MSEIPAEFAAFTKQKQVQLLTNILTSSAAGVALANGAALFAGEASTAVLARRHMRTNVHTKDEDAAARLL